MLEIKCEYCERSFSKNEKVIYPFVSLLSHPILNANNQTYAYVIRICKDCFYDNAPTELYNKLFP